ncbi:MAG: ABC-2 family transporter protein [Candidatus Obscuribacterales bacterium]|nr:ABC-2 family transporter protein [Candidatus Obscuribacterales bacterium]
MYKKLQSYFRLAGAYTVVGFKANLEYRGAFLSQMIAMFLNDSVWLVFWIIFFTRFPILKGWNVNDVITLWAVSAAGFGMAHACFGNAISLAGLITRGQLDNWLIYPRALLPHLLLGKVTATEWGDILFGYSAYLLLVHPSLSDFALFVFLTFAVAVLFLGFSILSGSLAFWLGNAENVCDQWRFAMITFSTYPASLFDGQAKLFLYTIIPAGFCSYFPVQALKENSLLYASYSMLGALAVFVLGVVAFYIGLRRYESGNMLEMRS